MIGTFRVTFRVSRVPTARWVRSGFRSPGTASRRGRAGFFARMPAAVRYFMVGLGIFVVLFGLA